MHSSKVLSLFFPCCCLLHPLLTTRYVPITLRRTEKLQGDCEGRGRRGRVGGNKIHLGKMHAPEGRQFGWEASSGRNNSYSNDAGRDLEVAVVSRLSATNLKYH